MAITLVGSATNTTYASRTNTTITAPTGLADGDLVLVGVITGTTTEAIDAAAPDGSWTSVQTSDVSDASFNVEMRVWRKFASGEGANWTFTHAATTSQGFAIAYRGVDPTTPLDTTATVNSGTGGTSTATGLTTVTDNALVLWVGHDWADTANNLTAPSGSTPTFTERLDVAPLVYLADGIKTPAGATGNKTMTNNTGGGLSAWVAMLIALRPDAGVVTTKRLPSTDEATNSWTNQAGSGTTIYQAIDETVADDTDYVQSALAATSGSYYETKLSGLSDPAVSTNHVLHYRYRASPAYASTNVTVSLRQGASTQVATATNSSIGGAWTTADVTLTGGEADAITDYSDIRIRVAPTGAAASAQTPAIVANTTATVTNLSAGATSAVTVDGTMAAAIFPGHYMVAWVAVDNSGASGARPGLTVADSRSNTWVVTTGALQDPGAQNAGASCYIAYAKVTTAYVAADTITFTWGAGTPTAKAISVAAFSGIHQTTPVAVTEVAANNANTAMTISITPSAANQLVVTAVAIEGASGDTWTNDADSTNGSWTPLTEVSTGNTGTGDMTLQGAFKAVSASGAQTWNSTITSRDWAANAIVFAPDAAGSRVQISWANLTVPVVTVTGTAAATLAFSATAIGSTVAAINGTATFDPTLAATAVGTRVVNGTASADFALNATAVGTRVVPGAIATAFALSATADGVRTVLGVAEANLTLTATAVGTKTVNGTASADFTLSATAAGTKTVVGSTADATFAFSATAVGSTVVGGTAASAFAFDAPAVGSVTVNGAISTALAFSSTATGTNTVSGSSAADFTFVATAAGTVVAEEVTGQATATLAFDAPAVGTRVVSGTATFDPAFGAPAVGSVSILGAAATSLAFSATATGTREVPGQAQADFGFDAPITGQGNITGTASADFAFSAPATGTVIAEEVTGTAATALTFAAPATGTNQVNGAADFALTFAAPAGGLVEHPGAAAAALSFASIGTGTRVVNGQATAAFTFDAPAVGTIVTPGAGLADAVFAFASNGDGTVSHTGTGEALFALTATATGTRVVLGQATSTFTFAAPAAGVQDVSGTAATDLTFDAPATGTRVVTGTATSDLTFLAPAAGTRVVTGSTADAFAFTSDGTGLRTVSGFAVATFAFDAPALGARELSGTAQSTFVFSSNAAGILGVEQFFSYGNFLEYIRAQVQAGTGRPAYLTFVPESVVPVEPYSVVHAFGATGATNRTYSGEAVGLSFYLQIDGVGRKYQDALWVLDRAVRTIRVMPCPSYVNDLLVRARSSAFEVGSEGLRAVGQRLAVNATRAES